jgi:hypothetical protein
MRFEKERKKEKRLTTDYTDFTDSDWVETFIAVGTECACVATER